LEFANSIRPFFETFFGVSAAPLTALRQKSRILTLSESSHLRHPGE